MVYKNRDSSPSSSSSDGRKRRFFPKKSKSLPLSLAAQQQELAKNSPRQDDRKHKHNVSFGDDKNCLAVSVVEFPNDEFCSGDANLRKKIWYSSLEIRAIKQANMDLVAKAIVGDEEQQSNTNCINKDSDLRGLEHLVEGETIRRERINVFIHSVCKVQQEEKGKGAKPEAVADAISIFSKSLTKKDRRQAAKVGKLDAAEVADEEKGRSGSNSLLPRRSFSSSRRSSNTSSSTSALLPRTKSGHSFHKRRTLIRRMSHRASWITGGASLLRSTSGSSSRSLQSTTSSTGSANSNNNSFATS